MRFLCGACVVLTACGFNPAGDDDGTDVDAMADADEGDGGGGDAADPDAPAIDAAMIDAAMRDAPIDAAVIDAAVVDAAMIDARPPCPGTYDVQSGGDNYKFVAIAAVWDLANLDCNDDLPGRTHLATFETAAKMDPAVSAINPGNSAEVHVGASCAANDCSVMNQWTWVTGTAVSASLWEGGQPDNGTLEKAAEVIRDMGTWKLRNVTQSLTTRPYICECDP